MIDLPRQRYAFLALAAALGAFCVRVTRIHFTILTLAIGMIVHALFFAGIVFKLGGDYGKGMFYIGYGGIVLPRLTILGSLAWRVASMPSSTAK